MQAGTTATLTRSFDAPTVEAYAGLAGDDNPVHVDAAYAAKTRFKKPIVHGMLYGSLFGTIFGATIPGAIYMSQQFQFKRPVYVGAWWQGVAPRFGCKMGKTTSSTPLHAFTIETVQVSKSRRALRLSPSQRRRCTRRRARR